MIKITEHNKTHYSIGNKQINESMFLLIRSGSFKLMLHNDLTLMRPEYVVQLALVLWLKPQLFKDISLCRT